jgi:mRNA interferase ChpB
MSRRRHPQPGDVYWIDPNPVAGREIRNRRPFVVITPAAINAFGISMAVPITTAGDFARQMGVAVIVSGREITGAAVCNQVRSFDIEGRVRAGSARFVETLQEATTNEIISRVLSIIDPEGA